MPDKIKVAFIGAGGMGREHARAFGDIDGVELAGIHSRTRARAEDLAAELNIGGVFDSPAEMYDRTGADLVVMAVPELEANAVAKAALEHPWAVLAEKPLGYNLADAEAIAAVAKANNRQVFVGLNRRFLSSTRAALDWLAEHDGPRYIQVRDQQSHEVARIVGQPDKVVEYWMYANSIHLVDYLRLLGRGRVTGVEVVEPYRGEASRVVLAKVGFDSGDVGLYEGIWQGPGPWAVTVVTPERRWEMRPLEQARYQPADERKLYPIDVHPWDETFKPGFRLQAEQAVAAVRGEASDLPTIDQALESMRLVHQIFGV